MTDFIAPESAPNHAPSRRAIIRSAAWSIPVIAVATTAPMAAASTEFVDAQNTLIATVTDPDPGTSSQLTFFAQIQGSRGYINGGSFKDGWYIEVSGDGASGFAAIPEDDLVGLQRVSDTEYRVVGEQQQVVLWVDGWVADATVTFTMFTNTGLNRGSTVINVKS